MRRRVPAAGVELDVLDEGEPGRPVALLVHGFPDSSHLWRNQLAVLNDAGLRVVAPDLRGFGGSDRPERVEDYRVGRSVADLVAVLDALEVDRARVVGHDFGAGAAWVLAARHPHRVERLVAMSVGHPGAQRRTIEAREKAWYTLLFQFEGVAEELLSRDDWALLREWLRDKGDVERYVADLSRSGALTAALNWYRANLHPAGQLEPPRVVPPVAAPTLGLWSTDDHYLTEAQMTGSAEHVTGPWRYERIEGASHWMQLDATERVNALLAEFLG